MRTSSDHIQILPLRSQNTWQTLRRIFRNPCRNILPLPSVQHSVYVQFYVHFYVQVSFILPKSSDRLSFLSVNSSIQMQWEISNYLLFLC